MPTYFIVEGVKIELYHRDHNPPHFHAMFAEFDATVEIDNGTILSGSLPANKKKQILSWARENKNTLQAIWNQLRK